MVISFPPDVPDHKGCYHVQGFLGSWMVLLVPMTAVVYYYTHGSILASIVAFVFLPAMGFLQGGIGLYWYRSNFRDAPTPISPAHGIVLVNPTKNHHLSSSISNTDHDEGKQKNQNDDSHHSGTYPYRDNRQQNHHRHYEKDDEDDDDDNNTNICACTCAGGQRWRRGGPLSQDEQQVMQKALDGMDNNNSPESPIRLLVLGDSLALGVGTMDSCTSILAECLAKVLSKSFQTSVSWTSHGHPGASTGWIVRELQKRKIVTETATATTTTTGRLRQRRKNTFHTTTTGPYKVMMEDELLSDMESSSSLSSDDSVSSNESSTFCVMKEYDKPKTSSSSTFSSLNHYSLSKWQDRLQEQSHCFTPNMDGPYDIVVVMLGGNDAKSACMPIMVGGEERELRKMAQRKQREYAKSKSSSSISSSLTSCSSGSSTSSCDGETTTPSSTSIMQMELERVLQALEPRLNHSQKQNHCTRHGDNNNKNNNTTTTNALRRPEFPLVVFPAMPTGLTPIFRQLPLRWLGVPILGMMDHYKQQLATKQPEASHSSSRRTSRTRVMYIPTPTIPEAMEYEAQHGLLWKSRQEEDTLIQLRNVTTRQCHSKSKELRQYYNAKARAMGKPLLHMKASSFTNNTNATTTFSQQQANAPQPPLSERSGLGGSKFFFLDDIHPTDEGYDFWGRHIAMGIVNQLQQEQVV